MFADSRSDVLFKSQGYRPTELSPPPPHMDVNINIHASVHGTLGRQNLFFCVCVETMNKTALSRKEKQVTTRLRPKMADENPIFS